MAEVYEPSFAHALKTLGHSVSLVDCSPGALPGLVGRFESRILVGPGIHRLRQRALDAARDLRPDYILIYQGHIFDNASVRELSKIAFTVGIHNDDPFGRRGNMLRYRHLLPSLGSYDGFHVYRDVNVAEAREYGLVNVAVLLPYYIPWLDYPRKMSSADARIWDSDVVFAGHFEPDHRGRCLAEAARNQLKVRIYGPARFWKAGLPAELLDKVGSIRPLLAEEYRRAMSGAKICACFFSKWNRDQYTRRVFEITACGSFLLAERTDFMREFFKEGVEVELFSDSNEFVDKAKFYLTNTSARTRVSNAGRKAVLRKQADVVSRAGQWLREIERWRADRRLVGSAGPDNGGQLN